MAYSPSPLLKIALIQVGTEDGTWGTIVNNYVFERLEQAIHGGVIINAVGNTYTLDDENFQGTESHYKVLMIQGVLTQNINIIVPNRSHEYTIINQTTGAFDITIKTAAGAGVTFTTGGKGIVYCNGTDVINIFSAGDFLFPANNLSDLDNIATARANLGLTAGETARTTLGLGTASLLDAGTSINNLVQLTANNTLPALDGSALSGIAYANTAFKSANYTALLTDRNKVLIFTNGATLTLPAVATAENGYVLNIQNAASGISEVVIDPSGSETIDGMITRTMRPGDSIAIICTGSAWRTLRGRYSWASGDITPTPSTNGSFSHNLSRFDNFQIYIRCDSEDLGYTVDDEIKINPSGHNASNAGMSLYSTSSTIKYQIGLGGIYLPNLDTKVSQLITPANWKMIIRAAEII